MMTELPGYDEWKTTEPRDLAAEWEDVQDLADEEAGEAYDDAAELASLFDSLGFEGEGPDPYAAAARASGDVILRARRGLEPFGCPL
ncbi:MAG TPA: hypothetical protein ENK57_21935 [Polyangiaceae bacterium]|nr:hypothetical protein [Polyangiaceae bacterium]